mmetsp:Transcript_52172/g.125994  ORF Transcript_52172/g.125994 Transcript_52172/m.125994 type:complete len:434 (-) Transcript_52172:130-1431(-)
MAEDRTSEFLSLAKSVPAGSQPTILKPLPPSSSTTNNVNSGNSLPGGQKSSSSSSSAPSSGGGSNANSRRQLRDFHTTAGGISRDIASTSQLLSELTQLVRQKSLFQDDTAKVNELVIRIKTSIENLNGRLDDAGRQIQQQKRSLEKNSKAGEEASNVVGQLKEEFGQAAAGFKTILQQRTDTLKDVSDRKKDIYGNGSGSNIDNDMEDVPVLNLENRPPVYHDYSNSGGGGGIGGGLGAGGMPPPVSNFPTLDLTSGMAAGEPSGSQLPRPHGMAYDGVRNRKTSFTESTTSSGAPYSGGVAGGPSTYYRTDSNPLSPWDIQRMEQESGQDQMMQLIPDQDYLQERANAMEQVESNIVELGTIFNRLAVMVNEHKDMVQRVEDNVDETESMINMSLATLTDTLTNLQTNRALAFKVFSILVVFIIAFIIFFA